MPDTAVVILTDCAPRANEIAAGLAILKRRIVVRDVSTPPSGSEPEAPRAVIVSDISFSQPASIAAVRKSLGRFSGTVKAHVCLIRHDAMRDRTQSNALGAGRVVCVERGLDGLRAALAPLLPRPIGRRLPKSVNAVSDALHEIMLAGAAGARIAPELLETGCELILAALSEMPIRDWLDFVFMFDDVTHRHCLMVAGLAASFASHLDFSPLDVRRLTRGALLHDIGKSRIPVSILNKPGPHDNEERVIMRSHAATGWEMLLGQGYDDETLAVVRSHHEMLDGSGYPDGLTAEAIPDIVRLITICDIFSALIERRSYKRGMGSSEAFGILEQMASSGRLDPALVRAFRPLAEACAPIDHRAAS